MEGISYCDVIKCDRARWNSYEQMYLSDTVIDPAPQLCTAEPYTSLPLFFSLRYTAASAPNTRAVEPDALPCRKYFTFS